METLTLHADFLRRMARALLRSDDQADDLVQDTFVVAMQKAPGDSERVRPWLLGIMRNQLRNRRRGARRRLARHRSGARPEAQPATAELIEKEDIRRRVVDALMALDEPLRTTMVLRFYEQLPPREVARRMDCPVETVRTRTRRGLERMRTTLDIDHSGDRKKWMAALTPWAAAQAGAGIGVGGLALKTAVVLLLAGAGWWAWSLISGDAHEDAPSAPRAGAVAAPDAAAPVLLGASAPRDAQPPAATVAAEHDAPADALRVRLAGTHGSIRAVGTLRVIGMWTRWDRSRTKRNIDRKDLFSVNLAQVLRPDGALALDVVAALSDPIPHALTLEVEHPDFEPTSHVVSLMPERVENGVTLRWFDWHEPSTLAFARARLRTADIEIPLRSLLEGTVVAARIVDDQGRALRHCPFHLVFRHADRERDHGTAYTRADGTLRLRDDDAREATLIVKAHGFETLVRTVELTVGRTTDLGTLQVSRGSAIRGTVSLGGIDPEGLRVLAVETPEPEHRMRRYQAGTVGADGTFEIQGLRADRTYVLRPHDDFGAVTVHAHASRGLATAPIAPGGAVHFDLDTLARVEVSCRGPHEVFSLTLTTKVKKQAFGSYQEPEDAPSWTWLVVPHTRYLLHTQLLAGDGGMHQRIQAGTAGSTTVVQALPPHAGLRLHLQTPDGRRVTRAAVTSWQTTSDDAPDVQYARSGRRTSTGYDTAKHADIITIWPLKPGRHLLHVVPEGEGVTYAPINLVLEVPEDGFAEHDVAIAPGGSFQVEVEATTEHFIGQVRIRRRGIADWKSPRVRQGTRAITDGLVFHPDPAVAVEPLAEGAYELEWRVNSGPPTVHDFTIRAGETTRVSVRVP